MDRTISVVSQIPTIKAKTKVAAYARVSCEKDAMLHSLSAQIEIYSKLIKCRPDWQYVGVYADEAITGTKAERPNFQRMLDDCRKGKIDMVITKSISRFARNTVTLLETVRELKSLNVDVYFEEQNIHTLSSDGELMLTILASYAQEESRSVSENMKWRVKRNFENGLPWNCTIFGYRFDGEQFVIYPKEAEIVKQIFKDYLKGKGCTVIAKSLNESNVATRYNRHWHRNTIYKILTDSAYIGTLTLQKTFRENHITKRTVFNTGQLPFYVVEDAHKAIIDKDSFDAVQEEIKRRKEKFSNTPKCVNDGNLFKGIIKCSVCGKNYIRKIKHNKPIWICNTYNKLGSKYCSSKQIPEHALLEQVNSVTDDVSEIYEIKVCKQNTLIFNMKNGAVENKHWHYRSKSDSWTDEMRKQASERGKQNG